MNMYRTFVRPSGPDGHRGVAMMEAAGGPMARAAVEHLAVSPDAEVLEIGFGPGLALAELVERLPAGHVTGIDPSELMHSYATARNAGAIADGTVVLVHGDVDTMPFADDRFDRVLASDNAHFWDDLGAGLAEVLRVLRPGGAALLVFSPPSGGPPSSLQRSMQRAGFADVHTQRTPTGVFYRGTKPHRTP